MGEDGGGVPENPPSATRNEMSGVVHGPVVQAGSILGDVNIYPSDAAIPGVDEWTEDLALGVRTLWQREEAHRRVHDPVALPVRWHAAPAELADHWANIRRVPAGALAEPLDLGGRIEELAEIYRRVPSRRLVFLGPAGAGKTVLASRLALDLLAARRPGDPVPVIVSVGSWDAATTPLNDWLASQLIRDHPGLAVRVGKKGSPTRADALIAGGRVLPVLDGFDEIASGAHQAALRQLNATPDAPVVITSRAAEYTATVRGTDVLTAAAVVELDDLTLEDLAAYLPRTAAGHRSGIWDPVLERMSAEPDAPGPATLRQVLASPLMVFLARTVYSDTPGHDPARLLDTSRFPSEQAVRDHLLEAFLPAVYEADESGGAGRWPADRARRYLTYLAGHLRCAGTPNLAWWQLRDTIPRPRRTLVFAFLDGLVAAVGIGIVLGLQDYGLALVFLAGVVTVLASGLTVALTVGLTQVRRGRHRRAGPRRSERLGIALTAGLAVGLTSGLVTGLALVVTIVAGTSAVVSGHVGQAIEVVSGRVGQAMVVFAASYSLLSAVVFGFVAALAAGFVGLRGKGPQPTRTRLQVRGRIRFIVRRSAVWFMVGLAASAVFWIEALATSGTAIALANSAGYALVHGFVVGLAAVVMFGLEAPVHPADVAGPVESLARDRRNAIRKMLTAGLAAGLVFGLLTGIAFNSAMGLRWSLAVAVVVGFVSVRATSAWVYWLVLVRGWLPLTGRLPWRVQAFLADAYQRGVLRQTGAVYQFRHARLQDHLLDRPGSRSADAPSAIADERRP